MSPARIPAKFAADNSNTLDTVIRPPSDVLNSRPARRMPIFQSNIFHTCVFDPRIHDSQKSRLQADLRTTQGFADFRTTEGLWFRKPLQVRFTRRDNENLFLSKTRTEASSGFRINNRHQSAVLDIFELFFCQHCSKFEALYLICVLCRHGTTIVGRALLAL